ncbi:MAG TPA: HAMP domain-containing sensor histidine kinase [Chloroflexota bacterium]|jgi:signal transduction histidine kinase
MPIRWRVALFGAGLVMLAMLGFSWLVYSLASSNPSEQAQAGLPGLRGLLVLAFVVVFIASLVASWLAAGRALRPLDRVARLMEEIGLTRDLGQRLPMTKSRDEVGRLSAAFNGMLQRLEETQQQLTSALEAQRRFVADSSHELRTPLTTVRSNAGLLLQRTDLAEEDRQAALRDIATESERMGRLVGDLLTLARADAGQQLQRAVVDLAGLLDEVVGQAQRAYPSRSISAWTETAEMDGDAEALKQLLWIMLSNAAKYTRDGGRIDLRLTCAGGSVVLAVADDGVGIPDGDEARIFDRFYRANAARSGEGAGLGLSIARWIVEQHGGTIVARNRAGGGAEFTVRLLANS